MARNGGGRRKVENCPRIDIREWQRHVRQWVLEGGTPEPGEAYRWYKSTGFSMAVEPGSDSVRLIYERGTTHVESAVWLDSSTCHYGGQRAWVLCPCCGRRVAILYVVAGSFCCRRCGKLAYACQSETLDDRSHRAANKIRRKLGWMVGIGNLPGSKPKGMHWRTYRRLFEKHNAAAMTAFEGAARALGLVNKGIDRLSLRKPC